MGFFFFCLLISILRTRATLGPELSSTIALWAFISHGDQLPWYPQGPTVHFGHNQGNLAQIRTKTNPGHNCFSPEFPGRQSLPRYRYMARLETQIPVCASCSPSLMSHSCVPKYSPPFFRKPAAPVRPRLSVHEEMNKWHCSVCDLKRPAKAPVLEGRARV